MVSIRLRNLLQTRVGGRRNGGIRVHGYGVHLGDRHDGYQDIPPTPLCNVADKFNTSDQKNKAGDSRQKAIYLLARQKRHRVFQRNHQNNCKLSVS